MGRSVCAVSPVSSRIARLTAITLSSKLRPTTWVSSCRVMKETTSPMVVSGIFFLAESVIACGVLQSNVAYLP